MPNITPRRGAFSAEAVLVDPADHAGPKRKAINSVQVQFDLYPFAWAQIVGSVTSGFTRQPSHMVSSAEQWGVCRQPDSLLV